MTDADWIVVSPQFGGRGLLQLKSPKRHSLTAKQRQQTETACQGGMAFQPGQHDSQVAAIWQTPVATHSPVLPKNVLRLAQRTDAAARLWKMSLALTARSRQAKADSIPAQDAYQDVTQDEAHA